MPRTTTMTVRLSGALSDFVAANVGEDGSYENISGIRSRSDQAGTKSAWNTRLSNVSKAELTLAFSAPDDTFHPLSAAEVIARNKARSDT